MNTNPSQRVSYPPTFKVSPPEHIYVALNEPVILPCQVDAIPSAKYQWLVNGLEANWVKPYYPQLIPAQILPKVRKQFTNSSQWSDGQEALWYLGAMGLTPQLRTGSYQCSAWNRLGRVISSPTNIELAELGSFYDTREVHVTVMPEEVIQLNCSVTPSNPKANIRWMVRSDDESVNFIKETRTRVTDDHGNLYIIHQDFASSPKKTTLLCSVNNPVLRTIRTGPDNHVYFPSSLTTQTGRQLPRQKPYVLYHSPSRQIALVNQSLSIKCVIVGYPLPQIVWQWANGTFEHETKDAQFQEVSKMQAFFRPKIRSEGTELFISSVHPHNAGIYRCSLGSTGASSRLTPFVSYEVIVEGPPVYLQEPKDLFVPIYGSAEFHCLPDLQMTNPPAEITWMVNGHQTQNYFDNLRKVIKDNTVHVYNATPDDTAVFQCKLANKHGSRIVNAFIHVWQQSPAIIVGPQKEYYVAEMKKARLPCKTIGAPKAEIKWTRNGQAVIQENEKIGGNSRQVKEDGTLEIWEAEMSDSGVYTCTATNKFGTSQASGRLIVRKQTRIVSGPKLMIGAEKIQSDHDLVRPHAERITENSSVQMYCEAKTDPAELSNLRLSWMKDGELLDAEYCQNNGRTSVSQDGGTLRIIAVTPLDSGMYTCIAENRLDNDSSTLKVLVEGKPDPPTNLQLTCQLNENSIPFAVLKWRLGLENNSPVVGAIVEFVVGTYRPPIGNLTKYHKGFYPVNGTEASSAAQTRLRYTLEYQQMWVRDSTEQALEMARQQALSSQWLPSEEVNADIFPRNSSKKEETSDKAAFFPSRTERAGSTKEAYLRLNPDAVYHFRVRLENHIGWSDPSEIVPRLGRADCRTLPQPSSSLPNELLVFGNKPRNLIVRWPPLPAMKHNGPGLIYILSVACLDCIVGPKSSLSSVLVVRDWSVGEVEIENLTTRESRGDMRYEEIRQWKIETFRTYEVALTTENIFGSNIPVPLRQTGHSGEGIPTVAPEALKAVRIGSRSLTLTWRRLDPQDIEKHIMGYFRGFRIEWCEAKMSGEMCDFYKSYQDYFIKKAPHWSLPHLRVSQGDAVGKSESQEISDTKTKNQEIKSPGIESRIELGNGTYVADLVDLPGRTTLKIWVRILNIQHFGPASDPIFVSTKEGVPDAVPEITATFIGVSHVELAWVKPLRTNGILTAYDLEVYQKNVTVSSDQEKTFGSAPQSSDSLKAVRVKKLTIDDPEQLAARISGLEVNTQYVIYIWARTKAGRGVQSSIKVRTAHVVQESSLPYFVVNAVVETPNAVNVCLSRSVEKPSTIWSPSENEQVAERSYHAVLTGQQIQAVSQARDGSKPVRIQLPGADSSPPWQNEQVFNPNIPAITKLPGTESKLDMFYAQFRKSKEQFWEETQRESRKPWIILKNLAMNEEYEVRVVFVKPSGRSTVSRSRYFRIPDRPGLDLLTDLVPSGTSRYPNSMFLIGSICGILLLMTSLVASVILICWCRRRTQNPSASEDSGMCIKSKFRRVKSGTKIISGNQGAQSSFEMNENTAPTLIQGGKGNLEEQVTTVGPTRPDIQQIPFEAMISNEFVGQVHLFPCSMTENQAMTHPLTIYDSNFSTFSRTYKL
ncbi:unnamed protein product [Calicophoron daubneyi]|uniref:Uncharacterized protein n=1 Tax=Calicophoron daubneyi TaxID=300641 RepID=A0AAV2TQR6_CALDB